MTIELFSVLLQLIISIISYMLNYRIHTTAIKIKYILYKINFFIVIYLKLIIHMYQSSWHANISYATIAEK